MVNYFSLVTVLVGAAISFSCILMSIIVKLTVEEFGSYPNDKPVRASGGVSSLFLPNVHLRALTRLGDFNYEMSTGPALQAFGQVLVAQVRVALEFSRQI